MMKKLTLFFLTLLLGFSSIYKSNAQANDDIFSMALTGDAIITRKLSVYNEPPFLEMIKIIRSADVHLLILKCFCMIMSLTLCIKVEAHT